MNLIRKALVRSLPLSMRVKSALQENGCRVRFDFESRDWFSDISSFLFDDGSALRSADVTNAPRDPIKTLSETGYFSKTELLYLEAVENDPDDVGRITLYWPAERTSLERWIAGSSRVHPSALLPAKEAGKIESIEMPSESAEPGITAPTTEVTQTAPSDPITDQKDPLRIADEQDRKKAAAPAREAQVPSRPVLTPWGTMRYGVVGGLRGTTFRRSYILHRTDRMCFAMMAGEKSAVQTSQGPFIEYLKKMDDWPLAHQSYSQKHPQQMETISIEIFSDGHCRFFCDGIQAVYWSGRLKKLMRFPNTQAPLKSRLHSGDFVLLIPGGWNSREAAEMREIFLYQESDLAERLSALLDYSARGKGVLLQGPEGVP